MDRVYGLATTHRQETQRRRSTRGRAKVAPMVRNGASEQGGVGEIAKSLNHAENLQREVARLQICVDDFVSAAPGSPWIGRAMDSREDAEPAAGSRGLPMEARVG